MPEKMFYKMVYYTFYYGPYEYTTATATATYILINPALIFQKKTVFTVLTRDLF